jgi:multicomponent Na+:H+ antiporter subunit E
VLTGGIDGQRLVSGLAAAWFVNRFAGSRLRHGRGSAAGSSAANSSAASLILRPAMIPYLLSLLAEIAKSNWMMARIVLSPALPVSPHFVLVRTRLRGELARVLYATSITLTPGTLSVSLRGDRLVVHAITREAAAGMRRWVIEDRLSRLEGPA